MNGLAYDSLGDVLYGINPLQDQLFVIDRVSGAAQPIGSPGDLGFPNANGLTFDSVNRILYATDNNTNSLFTIDTATGTGHFVATIGGGFSAIEGSCTTMRSQSWPHHRGSPF